MEYDVILVVVDKYTKWGYFIAYIEEIIVEEVGQKTYRSCQLL